MKKFNKRKLQMMMKMCNQKMMMIKRKNNKKIIRKLNKIKLNKNYNKIYKRINEISKKKQFFIYYIFNLHVFLKFYLIKLIFFNFYYLRHLKIIINQKIQTSYFSNNKLMDLAILELIAGLMLYLKKLNNFPNNRKILFIIY